PANEEDSALGRGLRRLTAWVTRFRWPVLIASAALVVASIWGMGHIRVETDYLGFFDADSSIRLENERVARALAGTQPIYLVLDGSEAGSVTQLETARALEAVQK